MYIIIMLKKNKRVSEIVRKIKKYLQQNDKIVDIGSGNCEVCSKLQEEGFNVTPVDIENKSWVRGITPILYDGKTLPFKNNTFDISLLITVLHHTNNPKHVLKEAARVSKRIIVMEDIYESAFQKYATFIMDSIYNIEFMGHPYSNKTESEWKNLFKNLGLKLLDTQKNNWWYLFTSGTFYLEK